MVIDAKDANSLKEKIVELDSTLAVEDYDEAKKSMDNMFLVISIFIYGFITVITIIGVTNIVNTLTTSLNLRRKEFAMLKSIGTTSKEFKQMINMECIFLGLKVLVISIPISLVITNLIYYYLSKLALIQIVYDMNPTAMIGAVLAVFLIVKIIMGYSMRQVNKQNIIETIRSDNV